MLLGLFVSGICVLNSKAIFRMYTVSVYPFGIHIWATKYATFDLVIIGSYCQQ